MTKGKLPSGMKWMEQGGEIFVHGTNAAGEKEWLVPTWASLSEADRDELSAIAAEMNAETEKARRLFRNGWECAVPSHENSWIDFHLRGTPDGGIEAKGRQWRAYGSRGREIDAVDSEWWDFESSLPEYRRDILSAYKADFGEDA
ncbi:MAG: hypothetical protein IJR68_04700 [Fretibacterium sp.]|nr:hypothetical protein [Fretibacterium sp.]